MAEAKHDRKSFFLFRFVMVAIMGRNFEYNFLKTTAQQVTVHHLHSQKKSVRSVRPGNVAYSSG